MVDQLIGRARQSINELNVALYVTKESSVEIVYESLEDVTELPEIVIFNIFPSSNMSVAFFRFKPREPEGMIH